MKPKILTNLGKYADANLKDKSVYITTSMTGNPFFESPIPSITEVQGAVKAYSNALEAAAGLDRVKVAEKNQARKVLLGLLTQLGLYVMSVANGDAYMLTSSGFTLAKTPEPGKLANPGTVTLSSGVTSGQMVSSIKRTKYARVYSYEIADKYANDVGNWTATHTTTSKHVFNGLVPGKQYWVRVAAIGTANQVTYSPISTMFVQ